MEMEKQPSDLSIWRESFTGWLTSVGSQLPISHGAVFLCDQKRDWIVAQAYGDFTQELTAANPGLSEQNKMSYAIYTDRLDREKSPLPDLLCGLVLPSSLPAEYGRFLLESCRAGWLALYDERRRELRASEMDKNKEVLFQITTKLLSKIDVDSVLNEVLVQLRELYPDSEKDMYLSQDYEHLMIPVKPLQFQNLEEDLCTRAFMEGKALHYMSGSGEWIVAAPLSGSQGVYGVVRLQTSNASFSTADIQFISRVCEAAGAAFEKAKLYEQSNVLVHELRLLNEITRRLNQSLKISEIFDYASGELIKIFEADFACLLRIDKGSQELVVQAGNIPSMLHEVFSSDYGFSGLVSSTKEPMIISDYWKNPKVSSKFMDVTRARSMMASPILIHTDVVGVILVAHRSPHHFSYENYKLLNVLSDHIGLALYNASLHAEVRRMVITDNLTGLNVRHYMDEQINLLQKKDFGGSLILLDIDHFKQVNDTYGHQMGDQILIQVASIIRSSIRDSDIAARWGGEEMAVYLPQAKMDHAIRVAERIRERVKLETDPTVTISGGVAEWSWDDEKISSESLFYLADMNLYKAKNKGRDQICADTV